jgi:hypothetical protein
MKTPFRMTLAITTAIMIASGSFAVSSKEAAANDKAGAFVAGTIFGTILGANSHRDRTVVIERRAPRECWYERRLVKVGYNLYEKRNVKVCEDR